MRSRRRRRHRARLRRRARRRRVPSTATTATTSQRVRRVARRARRSPRADGYGRWRSYAVTTVAARRGRAARGPAPAHRAAARARASTVAFALTKGEKPELVVQQLTELGVDRIVSVRAARSVVRWDDARAAAAVDAAAAGRPRGRRCSAAGRGSRSSRAGDPVRARRRTRGSWWRGPAASPAAPAGPPRGGEWLVVVGPEGGFDPGRDRRAGRRPPGSRSAPTCSGPRPRRSRRAPRAVPASISDESPTLGDRRE